MWTVESGIKCQMQQQATRTIHTVQSTQPKAHRQDQNKGDLVPLLNQQSASHATAKSETPIGADAQLHWVAKEETYKTTLAQAPVSDQSEPFRVSRQKAKRTLSHLTLPLNGKIYNLDVAH